MKIHPSMQPHPSDLLLRQQHSARKNLETIGAGSRYSAVDVPPNQSRSKTAQQLHGFLYLRQKQLLGIVPFSAATLWRKVKAGTFVRPVKLSKRITAWPMADVLDWLQEQEKQA